MRDSRNSAVSRLLPGLAALCLVLALCPHRVAAVPSGGAPVPRLGAVSLPEDIVVRTDVVEAGPFRDELCRSDPVLLSACPGMPVDRFVAGIRSVASDALRYQGYLRPRIVVHRTSRGGFLVEIHEGRRCNRADIVIEGARAVAPEVIRSALLARLRALAPPEAEEGETTDGALLFLRLDEQARKRLVAELRSIYADRGYIFASPVVTVRSAGTVPVSAAGASPVCTVPASGTDGTAGSRNVPPSGPGGDGTRDGSAAAAVVAGGTDTAVIVVDLSDEGPLCLLGGVEIDGVDAVEAERVRRFLALDEDTTITPSLMDMVRKRLERTGRFLSVSVAPTEPDAREGRCRCTLKVRLEKFGCSSVSEPLSRAERCMLAMRDDLAGLAKKSGPDWLCEGSVPGVGEFTAVFSMEEGLVLRLGDNLSKDGGSDYDRLGLVWSPRKFAVVRPGRGDCCSLDLARGRFELSLHVIPNPDYEPEQGKDRSGGSARSPGRSSDRPDRDPFICHLGMSLSFNRRPGERPVNLDLQLAPVAFVSLPGRPGTTAVFDGGLLELKMTRPDRTVSLRIQEKTGRLVSLSVEPARAGGGRFRLSSIDGAFGVMSGLVERSVESSRNLFDAGKPLESTLRYLADVMIGEFGLYAGAGPCARTTEAGTVPGGGGRADRDDGVEDGELIRRRLAAFRKLAVPPLVELVSAFIGRAAGPGDVKRPPFPPNRPAPGLGAVISEVCRFVATSDELVPAGAWPRLLARAVFAFVKGNPGITVALLKQASADQNLGPVGCLAISRVLGFLGMQAMARAFADLGLRILEKDGMRRDLLLVKSLPALRSAANVLVSVLRSVEPGTVDEASRTVSARYAAELKSLKDFVERYRDADAGHLIGKLVDAGFEPLPGSVVREGLRSMLGTGKAASPAGMDHRKDR